MSLFGFMSRCPACEPEQMRLMPDSFAMRIENLGANWLSYFTPSFLFTIGDRGDHWTLYHPPGFGQLLPEQAPLIALALLGLFGLRRRRFGMVLLGWLALAALPAAFIVPSGAFEPENRIPPSPWIVREYPDHYHNVPLRPGLLLAHPDSRHNALAMTPWILLSALGLVTLIEYRPAAAALKVAIVLLLAGVTFHGARFVRYYFRDYPTLAAPYFQYGLEDALRAIRRLDNGHETIAIMSQISQPYIYVLFYDRYPPALFQETAVAKVTGTGRVIGFDHYMFVPLDYAYTRIDHGIFLYIGGSKAPLPAAVSIDYPDGSVAYRVVVKP